MATSFLERLRAGPPIAPTAAWARSSQARFRAFVVPRRRTFARRESVVDLHLGFIRAGAELIETNTFGANRRKLATHFLEQELEQINSAGVKLARDAREVSRPRRLHRRLDRAAR